MKLKLKDVTLLASSIFISLLAGLVGSLFTVKSLDVWYSALNKPFFNPPNWIFGPVWTILYVLMGISLYLVIKKQKDIFTIPVKIFLFHLFVNALWSIVFFGLKNPGGAFFIILFLGGLILYLIQSFRQIDKKSSILLLPYLCWVSFASLLNLSIWYLNR